MSLRLSLGSGAALTETVPSQQIVESDPQGKGGGRTRPMNTVTGGELGAS